MSMGKPKTKRKRSVPRQSQSPVAPSAHPSDSRSYRLRCLRHFDSVTLPAFHRCEPSPLWDHIRTEMADSKSVEAMAIALGHEHYTAALPTPPNPPEDALDFYPDAVHLLRAAIDDAEAQETPEAMFTVAFHCLLLVILQCFRKSFDELNLHLQHGLRIAKQAADHPEATAVVPLDECIRLMKQYSIAVALFNPLLPQDGLCTGIPTTTANQALSDPDSLQASPPSSSTLLKDDQVLRAEMENLVLDLIRTTLTHRNPKLDYHDGSLRFASSFPSDASLTAAVTKLRERHAKLESAMQKRLLLKRNSRGQHFKIGSATTMLLGIYLRRRWSGYHCTYDVEFEAFSTILDRIQSALETERSQDDASAASGSSSAFSIGLGTIAPLFYVAMMCREPLIRRRAIELMSQCPLQDGPWNSKLAERITRTVMEFEERKAQEDGVGYALTGHIPEHCRVVYYYYHHQDSYDSAETVSDGCGVKERLRVFYRHYGKKEAYMQEDLELS